MVFAEAHTFIVSSPTVSARPVSMTSMFGLPRKRLRIAFAHTGCGSKATTRASSARNTAALSPTFDPTSKTREPGPTRRPRKAICSDVGFFGAATPRPYLSRVTAIRVIVVKSMLLAFFEQTRPNAARAASVASGRPSTLREVARPGGLACRHGIGSTPAFLLPYPCLEPRSTPKRSARGGDTIESLTHSVRAHERRSSARCE